MRSSVLALLLTTLVVAGCGGGGGSSSSAKANGEASKSADQVFADANHAATTASSMHVSGNINANGTAITLDFSTTKQAATGSMSLNGYSFDFIRIGNSLYIKGSDAFYKHFAGASLAQLLHDKWLRGSATKGKVAQLGQFTSATGLFALVSKSHSTLNNEGTKTYKGQSVVALDDSSHQGTFYVAATGKPYPVAFVGPTAKAGAITFGNWNAPVSASAPKGAIDISQVGGGLP